MNKRIIDAFRVHTDLLSSTYQNEVCMAGGAIKAVGTLLFSTVDGSVELNESDVEGLYMVVQALGDHVENLSEDLDSVALSLEKQIAVLEGKS